MSTSIKQLILTLSTQLKQRAWKLVTAESCTGGGLAYYLTEFAGSSTWFERGYVTYSNSAKTELLAVPAATLAAFGAVSAETATAMAAGALAHSQAQISVAITGIAGPDGGTLDKPVGTVWISACTTQPLAHTQLHHFSGQRHAIREQSIYAALEKLIHLCK